jgi:MYXO-CTERM domain-containing protein
MQKRHTLLLMATTVAVLAITSTASAVAPPYLEDFESESTCGASCGTACVLATTGWANDTANDDIDWTVDTGGTTSSFTGPPSGYPNGGKYLYVESSTPCNGSAQEAHLISPPLELMGTTTPTAGFFYHMFGGDMGTLHVDVSTDGGMTWTNDIVPSFTDDLDAWQTLSVDLTAYVGMTVNLRIRGIMGSGFESDMAVDEFFFFDAANPPLDVGVQSIDSLSSGCGLGMTETVTVSLVNNSPVAVTTVPLALVVDGGAPIMETYTGNLAEFGGTDTFTFAATADLSVAGLHAVGVASMVMGDVNLANDGASIAPFNGAVVNTFPYFESFDNGPTAWTSGGPNSEWEVGFPFDGVMFGANSGVTAWVTDLNGNYPTSHDGWVDQICGYDFTALTDPVIQLAIQHESEFSWDGARLESSIDGGMTWAPVGVLGDPGNWYNDGTIAGLPDAEDGWTGRVNTNNGSNGWQIASHALAGLAGQANVRLRVRFGSDTSVQDEGFAFDDVRIFDNAETVEVLALGPSASVGALNVNATNVHSQTLRLAAFGTAGKDITSVTLTQSGNIADAEVADVRLFLDDGDGVFDNQADTVLGNGTLAAGAVAINTTGTLAIAAFETATLFVEVDLVAATAGATVQFGVATPAMDIVEANAAGVVALNAPIIGAANVVVDAVSMLPFVDNFSGGRVNRSVFASFGSVFPIATTAGNMVGTSGASANDALVSLSQGVGTSNTGVTANVLPLSVPDMGAISFPNGQGTGAIDYLFDLSGLTAAMDDVWVEFAWNNTDAEDADEDNAFLSLDGGASWALSLARFDFSTELPPAWNTVTVDLSTLLTAEGLDYSAQTVLRLQAADNAKLGFDGVVFDDVFVGKIREIGVERMATDIPETTTDALGTVSVGNQSVMYTIRNDGDSPLDVSAIASAAETNVSGVMFGAPAMNPVPPQASTTFQVDYTIDATGAFSFDIAIAADDPRLGDGAFDYTVAGDAIVPMPEIDIQRPAGTSIASGMTDAQGSVDVGVAQTLTYTVENVGTGDLSVGAATIANASNATATATGGNAVLGAGETADITVDFTADATGDFSFDLSVASDDGDENPYVITVSGTGADGGTGGGGMGGGTSTGGSSAGGSDGSGGSAGDSGAEGGCGCSTPGGGNEGGWALLFGSMLAFGAARRRRRR